MLPCLIFFLPRIEHFFLTWTIYFQQMYLFLLGFILKRPYTCFKREEPTGYNISELWDIVISLGYNLSETL